VTQIDQPTPTPETRPIPATVSRSFRLSNGCELSFASHQFGTLVSNGNPAEPQIFPGWPVDNCIKHFQIVWKAISLTWEETTPDCQIVINGWAVEDEQGHPRRLHVADATAWFMALMRRFPGSQIEVRRDGVENPVLVTASSAADDEADYQNWLETEEAAERWARLPANIRERKLYAMTADDEAYYQASE
jgi:hypothetical protein